MTPKELEKYLWTAATQLRVTIDTGDYKQYIFQLMFLKRIFDVYDEEFENTLVEIYDDIEYTAFVAHYYFQITQEAHWNDAKETTINVGVALQDAILDFLKQKQIGPKLKQLDELRRNIDDKIQTSKSLQKSLINQVF